MRFKISEDSIIFRFKGDRDYVHGPDIFDAIVQYVLLKKRKKIIDISNIKMTFHRIIRTNTKILSYYSKLSSEQKQPACTFTFQTAQTPTVLCLVETSEPIHDYYDYSEEEIKNGCQIDFHNQEITVHPSMRYSQIETIVAATKELHHRFRRT